MDAYCVSKRKNTTLLPKEGQGCQLSPPQQLSWGRRTRGPEPRDPRTGCLQEAGAGPEQCHPILLLTPQCQAKAPQVRANSKILQEGHQEKNRTCPAPSLMHSAKGRPKTGIEQAFLLQSNPHPKQEMPL